jgi:hypothetical protein
VPRSCRVRSVLPLGRRAVGPYGAPPHPGRGIPIGASRRATTAHGQKRGIGAGPFTPASPPATEATTADPDGVRGDGSGPVAAIEEVHAGRPKARVSAVGMWPRTSRGPHGQDGAPLKNV